MLVEHRDLSLRHSVSIRDEKVRLVLDWLLEFRYSSSDILAARLGQTKKNANAFFSYLVRNGLVIEFKNVHTYGIRCFMLSSSGARYLSGLGRDTTSAVVRVKLLSGYSKMLHDLSVQNSVISRISKLDSVIWDRNIPPDMFLEKPDAIMVLPGNGRKIAIEYERTRKDTKRIYYTFLNHVRAIQDSKVSAFFYDFQSSADCAHYKKLFLVEDWPIFKRDKKFGAMLPLNDSCDSTEFAEIKNNFSFSYLPYP